MSTRPPPLRANEQPPSYRVVTRVYKNSLRPVVVVLGSLAAIWSLIWAIPAFQDINEDKSNGLPKFAAFDIALGVIYASACAIEAFGVLAAAMQRLPLIRTYAYLSVVASIAVVAAGFLRVVIHFVFKNDLINECEQVVQGQGVEFRFGIWGPRVTEKLDAADAQTFCNRAWSRDSLDEILYLIFEILFSLFFTMIAFAYYHQARDPTSPANVQRGPAAAAGVHPDHYNRPYDAEGAAPPYNPYQPPYQPQYAPPPGPPPTDMGYGVGMGMGGEAKDKDMGKEEHAPYDNPFADFDEPSKPSGSAHTPVR